MTDRIKYVLITWEDLSLESPLDIDPRFLQDIPPACPIELNESGLEGEPPFSYGSKIIWGDLQDESFRDQAASLTRRRAERFSLYATTKDGCYDNYPRSNGVLTGSEFSDPEQGYIAYLLDHVLLADPKTYEETLGLPKVSAREVKILSDDLRLAYADALETGDGFAVLSQRATDILMNKVYVRQQIIDNEYHDIENRLPQAYDSILAGVEKTSSILTQALTARYEQAYAALQAELRPYSDELNSKYGQRYRIDTQYYIDMQLSAGGIVIPHHNEPPGPPFKRFRSNVYPFPGNFFMVLDEIYMSEGFPGYEFESDITTILNDGLFDLLDRTIVFLDSEDIKNLAEFLPQGEIQAIKQSLQTAVSQAKKDLDLMRDLRDEHDAMMGLQNELDVFNQVRLSGTGQEGLPLARPAVIRDAGGVIWEGTENEPFLPENSEDLSFVNAGSILESFTQTNAFVLSDYTLPSTGPKKAVDLGLGTTHVSFGNVSEETRGELTARLTEAMEETTVPDDKEAYFESIGNEVSHIRFVDAQEMRQRWLSSLEIKVGWAKDNLYKNPEKAKAYLYDALYGKDLVPEGLASPEDDTIYLLATGGDLKNTFRHEVAHMAWYRMANKGVLSGDQLDAVDAFLKSRYKTDGYKISRHFLVKNESPDGMNEWRADALATYWSDPDKLKQVDPELYYLIHWLHYNMKSAEQVTQEAIVDDDGNIVQPEETAPYFWLEPVNPLTDMNGRRDRAEWAMWAMDFSLENWGVLQDVAANPPFDQ